ncbi:MAG: aminopeptidase P family protein [Deltaproteobacteria bacterium]|nr:aminopeptidase P family protein [Deltaproteobacteria bacterium]
MRCKIFRSRPEILDKAGLQLRQRESAATFALDCKRSILCSVTDIREPLFPLTTLDLPGLLRAKRERLQAEMNRRGVEALWLFGPGHLRYLLGAAVLPSDAGRTHHQRTAALLRADAPCPHVFTPNPEQLPAEIPDDFIHPPLYLESESGVVQALRELEEHMGASLQGALAVDEYSPGLFFELERRWKTQVEDASTLVAAVKLCKLPDEIECIRRAQSINEAAMTTVQASLRAGLRQSDLSALFFEQVFSLGANANGIDPIWQVMEPRIADGPWTTHGHVAFPTCTSDRILRRGDVLWVDAGIDYCGYQSDFGRTFVVDAKPSPQQLDQGKRWLDVVRAVLELVKPGVTGATLTRRAVEVAGGTKPWLEHFYLIHGVGTEPAEQPLLGTDLGEAFDESLVLAPGMTLVLEPAIWQDGHAGYRSEEIVAVTEDGYQMLSDFNYAPYEESMTG